MAELRVEATGPIIGGIIRAFLADDDLAHPTKPEKKDPPEKGFGALRRQQIVRFLESHGLQFPEMHAMTKDRIVAVVEAMILQGKFNHLATEVRDPKDARIEDLMDEMAEMKRTIQELTGKKIVAQPKALSADEINAMPYKDLKRQAEKMKIDPKGMDASRLRRKVFESMKEAPSAAA